jgi:hypothetical protein
MKACFFHKHAFQMFYFYLEIFYFILHLKTTFLFGGDFLKFVFSKKGCTDTKSSKTDNVGSVESRYNISAVKVSMLCVCRPR